MAIQRAALGSLAGYSSLLERLHTRAAASPGPAEASASMQGDRLIRSATPTYTVRSGDSLTTIARRLLGDAARWPELYALNQDLLKHPDHIFPGQVLRLPGAPSPATASVAPPAPPQVPAQPPVPPQAPVQPQAPAQVEPPVLPQAPAQVQPPVPPQSPTQPTPMLASFSDLVARYRAAKLGSLTPDQLKTLGQRDKTAFFEALRPAAVAAEQQFGVPAAVTLAQAALESGWGAHAIGGYNIFGIKGRGPGGTVGKATREYEHGRWVTIDARFARYQSFDQAILEHGRLFHNGYYGRALNGSPDPRAFARNLEGVYATDPQYAEKLIDIMDNYNLA